MFVPAISPDAKTIWRGQVNLQLGASLRHDFVLDDDRKIEFLSSLLPVYNYTSMSMDEFCSNVAQAHVLIYAENGMVRIRLTDPDPSITPQALLFAGFAHRGSLSVKSAKWQRTTPSWVTGHDAVIILTNADHRAGFINREDHAWEHVFLGEKRFDCILPGMQKQAIETYVETGIMPKFHGPQLPIIWMLESMTPKEIVYGTATRFERKKRAEQMANDLGINLAKLAKESNLGYVLDLPDERPLTSDEHRARDGVFNLRPTPKPRTTMPQKPYYATKEAGVGGAMAEAFANIDPDDFD